MMLEFWNHTWTQVPEGGKFIKGLAVLDDIAFFGVSVWSDRAARGDPAHDSQLAAFCLRGMALLWRHEVICVPSLLVMDCLLVNV